MGKLQLDCLPIVLYTTKSARFAIMMNSFISAICFINKSSFLVAFVLVSVECLVNVLVFFDFNEKWILSCRYSPVRRWHNESRLLLSVSRKVVFVENQIEMALCTKHFKFICNKQKKRIPIPCRNVDVIFYDVWPHKCSAFLCW